MIINEKSEFTLDYDGGLALIAESEASWNKMMRSVGITEEFMNESGMEVLNEGAKEFFAAIKKWFQEMLNKIKTFFREFIAKLKGKNKQLQEKAEKVDKAPVKKDTFEGFVFTNLDRPSPNWKAYHYEYKMQGNRGTWSTWNDEETDNELKSYEKGLTNDKYMDDEIEERLKKFFRNGKVEKSDVLSYYKSLNISNELKSLDKYLDEVSAHISKLEGILQSNIKEAERMERESDNFMKSNFDVESDAGKKDHANIMHSVGNWGKLVKIPNSQAIKYENARLSAINEAMDQLNRYMSGSSSTNESYLSRYLDKVII